MPYDLSKFVPLEAPQHVAAGGLSAVDVANLVVHSGFAVAWFVLILMIARALKLI